MTPGTAPVSGQDVEMGPGVSGQGTEPPGTAGCGAEAGAGARREAGEAGGVDEGKRRCCAGCVETMLDGLLVMESTHQVGAASGVDGAQDGAQARTLPGPEEPSVSHEPPSASVGDGEPLEAVSSRQASCQGPSMTSPSVAVASVADPSVSSVGEGGSVDASLMVGADLGIELESNGLVLPEEEDLMMTMATLDPMEIDSLLLSSEAVVAGESLLGAGDVDAAVGSAASREEAAAVVPSSVSTTVPTDVPPRTDVKIDVDLTANGGDGLPSPGELEEGSGGGSSGGSDGDGGGHTLGKRAQEDTSEASASSGTGRATSNNRRSQRRRRGEGYVVGGARAEGRRDGAGQHAGHGEGGVASGRPGLASTVAAGVVGALCLAGVVVNTGNTVGVGGAGTVLIFPLVWWGRWGRWGRWWGGVSGGRVGGAV